MKIGLAQICSRKGSLTENIAHHLEFTEWAAQQGCRLVVFPELSLTGYYPEIAPEYALSVPDVRIWPLQEYADRYQIRIAAGAPVRIGNRLGIGMIWFTPDTFPVVYTKQRIHPSEEAFFDAFDTLDRIVLDGLRISPAICYESTLVETGERAGLVGTDLYLVSTAKTKEKLPETLAQLQRFSSDYGFTTLLVNSVGASGVFNTTGNSCVWDGQGQLLGSLGGQSEALLVYDSMQFSVETMPFQVGQGLTSDSDVLT